MTRYEFKCPLCGTWEPIKEWARHNGGSFFIALHICDRSHKCRDTFEVRRKAAFFK